MPHLAAGEGGGYDATHVLPSLIAEVDQSVDQGPHVHAQTGSVNKVVELFDQDLNDQGAVDDADAWL